MPEIRQPQQPKDVDLEQIEFLFSGSQTPDDRTAVKLVTSTFGKYESQRLSTERRWDVAARLYHGVVEERNWPGSDVKRASLAVPIVYDQIESAHPLICEALFSYWPTFFDVTPLPGSTPAEASQVRDVIAAYLETPNDASGITPITQMKMAIRQMEKLGDGALELSWDPAQKRFIVEWVDSRDLYLDRTSPGPAADWTPALIHRALMTVEDLRNLRDTEGVKIPSDEVLNWFAKARMISSGDMVKEREAYARKETMYIGDLRPDPRHQLVEVLKYTTADRIIWVLGRMWTAINAENPYGFINYVRAPWTLVEGSPYSMSLPDVLEGDQKYAQGIRNARIDNLSLTLIPPRKRVAGTPTTPGKEKWFPGHVDQVTDAKNTDLYQVQNVTADAYQEEQIIHTGAAKRTGVNEMVQSGIPTPSNANRNATGVAAQQKAVGTRLSTHVSNIEEFMIVPMLYKLAKMIQKFAPEKFEIINKTGQAVQGTRELFNKAFNFRVEAANRMIVKERLAMFLGPVSQLIFNEAVLAQANKQGKTIDFDEWIRFFQDATGTSRAYQFFRAATPQEMQAMQQPDPKTIMEWQKAQLEAQTRQTIMDKKVAGEKELAQLDAQVKTHGTGEKSAVELLKILAKEREPKKPEKPKAA